MKSVETYLHDIQDELCDKIVHHWEDDQRFANQREMQQYNCGIAEAMEIIRNVLDGREFKSPLLQSMKEWFTWKIGRGDDLKKEKNLYILRDYDNNYFYVVKAVSEEKAIDLVSNYTGLGDEVNWMIDLADNEDGKIIQ